MTENKLEVLGELDSQLFLKKSFKSFSKAKGMSDKVENITEVKKAKNNESLSDENLIVLDSISDLAKVKGYIIKINKENLFPPSDSEKLEHTHVFSDEEKIIWEDYCILLIDKLKNEMSLDKALISVLKKSVHKYGDKGTIDTEVMKLLSVAPFRFIGDNFTNK